MVLLALISALVGGMLASHIGHEVLDDVLDFVHVSGVDRALVIFLLLTRLRSNYGLLLKELGSLRDALLEKIKVHQVLSDLSYRQVDKNASDLRRITPHELQDEFVNSASNSLLVLGVQFVYLA